MILYEVYHLNQYKIAYYGQSNSEELTKLYKIFYDAIDESKANWLKYKYGSYAFFNERNA